MRILISNPDTIGDVVLRQPLFAALAAEGHELAVVVRPLVQPIAGLAAPTARLIECGANPYEGGLEADDESLDGVAEAAREFAPDVFLAAPYTWTTLEARLAGELSEARRIGMSGGRFVPPSYPPPADESRFDEIIRVNEDLHELRKSEALARAVLGRRVTLENPTLDVGDDARHAADAVLAGLDLPRGEFLAACVAHHEHTAVRNWPPERWVELLAHWSARHGRPLLLVGGDDERPVADGIAEGLETKGLEPRRWFGRAEGDTVAMAALLEAARCYVGRDTGPMHLAAAVGRPVFAVFGGGTWPRFRPLAMPSYTITLAVPCSPCDWRCEQRRSYCVKDVPLAEVRAAADRFESGAIAGAEVRQVEPSRAMLATIAGDATRAAQDYKAELLRTKRGLADAENEARRTRMSESAVMQRLERLEQAIQRNAAGGDAQRRASEISRKLDQSSAQLAEARKKLANAAERAESSGKQAQALRDQVAELRQKLQDKQAAIESLRRESEKRVAEAERRAEQRIEEARGEVRAAEQERDAARQDARALRERASKVDVATLRKDLSAARRVAAAAQGRQQDMALRIERLVRERRAIEKLADQRLEALQWTENKLSELLASRWRLLGQRLGVAQQLPWEEQARRKYVGGNGHASARNA
ncbi:MAG: glycosyltransferase family 9 protein [Planctomycetota bacterium]